MKPELSVLIPHHNEPRSFMMDTINSVRDTIDVSYEIIVIDDCSRIPLEPIEGVTVLRHKTNLGVGAAFDTGAKVALSDNLFLMGSDIRFLPGNWASKMVKEIENHPKAITCATCIGLNNESPEGMDMNIRRNRSRKNGATIIFFEDHDTHAKRSLTFRNILECQWLPLNRNESKESYEIPSVLGAAYGISKTWYNEIDGWWGHRSWGTLEPMISLKSWFFGGSCRTAPDIEAGHIFKRDGTHGTPNHHLIYNKLLLATLLFGDYDTQRLINFLGMNPQVASGMKMFNEHKKEITKKKSKYAKKLVLSADEYCRRWNIDFRN